MNNNFKKFKKGPLIASVIFFVISIAVFVILKKEINNNNQITKERDAELQAATLKKDETKSSERLLKLVENERTLLGTHFIKSSDVVVLLDAIENLAPLVRVKAEVTQVDVAPDNTSLSVGLSSSGTFEALYKFLKLLENAPYQLEITSMNMQKVGFVEEVATTEGEAKVAGGVQWSAIFKLKLLGFIQ